MKKLITISILVCLLTSCCSSKKLHSQSSNKIPDGSYFENEIMILEKHPTKGSLLKGSVLKVNISDLN